MNIFTKWWSLKGCPKRILAIWYNNDFRNRLFAKLLYYAL